MLHANFGKIFSLKKLELLKLLDSLSPSFKPGRSKNSKKSQNILFLSLNKGIFASIIKKKSSLFNNLSSAEFFIKLFLSFMTLFNSFD